MKDSTPLELVTFPSADADPDQEKPGEDEHNFQWISSDSKLIPLFFGATNNLKENSKAPINLVIVAFARCSYVFLGQKADKKLR